MSSAFLMLCKSTGNLYLQVCEIFLLSRSQLFSVSAVLCSAVLCPIPLQCSTVTAISPLTLIYPAHTGSPHYLRPNSSNRRLAY